jgi:spoIIIJ-associated protein
VSEAKYTVPDVGPDIEDFIGDVIRLAGFDLKLEVTAGEHAHPDLEDPDVVVKFTGSDVDLLLANRGELLLALEQLTLEVLGIPSEDHSLLCFDANDYRLLRIEELRLSAVTAAARVKQTRKPFHFSPMSSRERRIIHLSLRNETDVKSLSTGAGPWRQVVIMPSEMEQVPEPIRPPAPRPDFVSRARGGGDRDRRGPHGRPPGRGGPRRGGGDRGRSGPPRRRD